MFFSKKMLVAACLLAALQGGAQRFPEHSTAPQTLNKGNAILVNFALGTHLPKRDLAKRFGQDGNLGMGLEWMSEGYNFIIGVSGSYLFGQKVNEDPLAILRTPEGDIIANDQTLASVFLRQRGFYIGGHLGRLFSIASDRSGIRITAGAGMLSHKIRLQDDNRSVPMLSGDYIKGFDRLTRGFTLHQFIGWQHLAKNRRANWFVGIDMMQGFTRNVRSWDYNDMRRHDESRRDFRFGMVIGWTLPFYLGEGTEIEY